MEGTAGMHGRGEGSTMGVMCVCGKGREGEGAPGMQTREQGRGKCRGCLRETCPQGACHWGKGQEGESASLLGALGLGHRTDTCIWLGMIT